MKPEIVAVAPMVPEAMAALDDSFAVHRLWEASDRAAWLAERAPVVRGMATTGGAGASAALIDALPKLEVIACFGVGVDAIDLARARERGIPVTNTPDVLTEDVADLGIALILATMRRVCLGDRFVRAGRWRDGNLPLARSIGGKRLGILGMGRIGQAAAHRAEAFGMTIAYHGPRSKPDLPYRYEPDLVALARDSDVLMVCTPGGAATRHLVDRAVLDALGPEGTLVNIARGSVVDEPALVAALREGRLGSAGLDVFADEPQVPDALLALDQVVLQPHVASATTETRGRMGDLVVENLRAHFAGRPLLTPV